MESLVNEVVCHEHTIATIIPDPEEGLTHYEQAVELALANIRNANVPTRWSDASDGPAPSDPLASDPEWTARCPLLTHTVASRRQAAPVFRRKARDRAGQTRNDHHICRRTLRRLIAEAGDGRHMRCATARFRASLTTQTAA